MKKNIALAIIFSFLLAGGIGVIKAYESLDSNRLYFNGYQIGSKIVSEIGDNNYGDTRKYSVEAIVYVGSSRYSSGWKYNYAYRSADRSFWHNETAKYNYVIR